MSIVIVFISFVLCAIAIATGASAAQIQTSPWKQWSCDQLTPNLCDDLQVETGSLVIRSIPVKYWRYKRKAPFSSEKEDSSNSDGTISNPIIAIHGGPAWPHNYLLPLKQLACRGTEVIFYDQAGCGKSTLQQGESVSTTAHPHLLDTAYYSQEELPALINHWKLDKYHILGHSWGTILAQEFALNARNTSGMQSLILSGPLSDAQSYVKAQWDTTEGNLGSLPPFIQNRIHAISNEDAYDSPEYAAINEVLTTFFTLRTAPAPDCFTSSLAGINGNVYVGMQGPSEFSIGGVLQNWNVTGRLHEVDVPVLLTHGEFDTMRPSIVKTMERELKLVERVLMPHSGHVSMIDDAGLMNDVVADFLEKVEERAYNDDDNGIKRRDDYFTKSRDEEEATAEVKTEVVGWLKLWAIEIAVFLIGLLVGIRPGSRS